MRITVIGGLNADIGCTSRSPIRMADSNPALVRMSAGGVGRNIAENLLRLGADLAFVSAIGDDGYAHFLRDRMAEAGLDDSHLIVRKTMGTGLYIFFLEPSGKLFTAINDMEAVESIGPSDLENLKSLMSQADLVIVDANLSPETLAAAARITGDVPLMADTVSVEKAPRLAGILPRLSLLKANRAEAEALAGFPLDSEAALREGCGKLLSSGSGELHISLGAQGACCASKDGVFMQPALSAKLVNVNGAGDAFAAGIAYRYCSGGRGIPGGKGAVERCLFGSACAAITLEHEDPVYGMLTEKEIMERMRTFGPRA